MKRNVVPYVLLFPSVILLAVVVLVPLLWNLMYSVQAKYLLGDTPQYHAQFVGLENYVTAISGHFAKVFGGTLIYTLGTVAGELALGMGLALLLNEKIRGTGIPQAMLLTPWVIPSAVAAIVWRWMLNNPFGIVNALIAALGFQPITFLGDIAWAMPTVILVSVWKGFPIITVMLLAALRTVREDLLEAATLDGAGSLQRFRNVTLPSVWPTLSLAFLISVIWSFQYFDLPWLLTQGGPFFSTETLAIYIYRTGFLDFYLGVACAIATIMFLILMVMITPYLRRSLAE